MKRLRRERKKRKDEIAGCQQDIERGGSIDGRIVVLNPARKSLEHSRQRAADCAKSDDADRAARQARSIKDRTPALKFAAPNQAIAGQDVARQAEHQRERQLRGRFGEQIRHDGEPDAEPRAGINIEIVAALQRPGDDLQIRTFAQECFVQRIGHEDHQRVGVARGRPNDHFGVGRKQLDGFRENGAA